MIHIKSALEASFAKLLANLKARLDARTAGIMANLKATLDANSARLLNDLRARLAAIDASHSALLDKIRSRLDGPAAQALSNEGAPGSNPHDADEYKVFVRRTRIRRFFSYVLRVLITGRLRPPVVGQREPIPQPRTDAA